MEKYNANYTRVKNMIDTQSEKTKWQKALYLLKAAS